VGSQVFADENLYIPPGELQDPGKEYLDRKIQNSSNIGLKTILKSRYCKVQYPYAGMKGMVLNCTKVGV
jgi:hypothetical protein